MALFGPFVIGRSNHFVVGQSFRNRSVMCAITTYHYSMERLKTSEMPVVRAGRDLNSGSPTFSPVPFPLVHDTSLVEWKTKINVVS